MHEVQQWRRVVTRSLAGTFVLLMALVTHMMLALCKLANRSTLRLPPWELVQIGLGLLIPFLLLPAHRQHARRPRVVRRRGQLPLRAGAPVAGQRDPAEHAAGAGVAARLHRHPLLAAALRALSRRRSRCCCSSPSPCRSPRSAASWCRGAPWPCSIENPRDVRQGQGADALAERRRRRQARRLPLAGPAGLRRRAAARRPLHRLALLRAAARGRRSRSPTSAGRS